MFIACWYEQPSQGMHLADDITNAALEQQVLCLCLLKCNQACSILQQTAMSKDLTFLHAEHNWFRLAQDQTGWGDV